MIQFYWKSYVNIYINYMSSENEHEYKSNSVQVFNGK